MSPINIPIKPPLRVNTADGVNGAGSDDGGGEYRRESGEEDEAEEEEDGGEERWAHRILARRGTWE